jgi:hypothetical protein
MKANKSHEINPNKLLSTFPFNQVVRGSNPRTLKFEQKLVFIRVVAVCGKEKTPRIAGVFYV